jgi:hypothetical protein
LFAPETQVVAAVAQRLTYPLIAPVAISPFKFDLQSAGEKFKSVDFQNPTPKHNLYDYRFVS